jgi:hypothetical protein
MLDDRVLQLFEGLRGYDFATGCGQDANGIPAVLALRVEEENFIVLHE